MTIKQILVPLLCLVLLPACDKQESAPTTAAPTPAAEAPLAAAPATAPVATDSAHAVGEGVYKKTCFLCHGTGAGGAPLLGDGAEWGPRQAKGTELLYQHAIAGFTGEKGVMPPKGANPALSDDEIKATVDYMLLQVK